MAWQSSSADSWTEKRTLRGQMFWFTAVFLCTAATGWSQSPRPNIVFIYADDFAAWATGVAGHPQVRTPNLDRLAREGANCVNAFTTTPVCSPSRVGLFASRYGSETGITDWINPRSEPDLGLSPDYVLWPEVLQRNGYVTGLVGKWHLGVPPPFHPTKNGFDYFVGFLEGGTSPRDPVLEKGGKPQTFSGFSSDIIADHAIEFLKQNHDRPFSLSVHFRAPHAPYIPVSDADWKLFQNVEPTIPEPTFPGLDVKKVREKSREYFASVHEVDRNVGRLLAELDQMGLSKHTAVIFTSDHGYNIGHHGVWHKGNGQWIVTNPETGTENIPQGQRPNMFDTSIRVPCLIRWPERIRPQSVVSQTITNLDWYPTLLAMTGVSVPEDALIRGRNFLPLLEGQNIPWNNDVYCEYSTHHQSKTHMRAYRTTEWKLVKDFLNSNRDELYHLKTDPLEQTNLIHSDTPDVREAIQTLEVRIRENRERLRDPVLKSR